jgi:hypothetical protein
MSGLGRETLIGCDERIDSCLSEQNAPTNAAGEQLPGDAQPLDGVDAHAKTPRGFGSGEELHAVCGRKESPARRPQGEEANPTGIEHPDGS